MPKLQIMPKMLPNKGIVLDKPEEMLLHNFSPHSRNMEFYNELIQGRLGLAKLNNRVIKNPIAGGSFEFWTAGADAAPDGWAYTDVAGSVARESTIVKLGTYALKMTRNGADDYLYQSIHSEKGIDYWKGKTITLTCWVKTSIANAVFIRLYTAPGGTNSSYHTGGGDWELLTVTHTVPSNATEVTINLMFNTTDGDAYYDGAMLVEGSTAVEYEEYNGIDYKITNIDQYWKFTSSWWLMVCTKKDIYAWDFTNTRWDILTKVYTTGTIEIALANLDRVLGTGTSWDTELKAGDFIKVGSGSVHTGAIWYEIETVDSATQLTLTKDAFVVAAGANYVARQTFTGDDDQYWWSVTFQDKNLGETWIATNGKDTPVRWTGSGQAVALSNLPTGFVSAKYVETYKNRVMFAWTVEVGNQPQRERWSAVADCEDWDNSDFYDFVDEDTWIVGVCNFNDYHIVMKEYEGYIGRHVGGAYIFDYERSTTCIGCKSSESLIPRKDYVYYFGRDNQFHRWNLLRDESISIEILPETKSFDPNGEQYIYGWDIDVKHQIRWHCIEVGESYNNYTVIYDYVNEILQVWQYQSAQACAAIGEYLLITDLYVDAAVWGEYYVDEQDGYWDARIFEQNAAIPIYGGYDGYVRTADIGYNDDGSSYNRVFRSIRDNQGMPDQYKRLWKQEVWLESDVSGSVTVKIRNDDETAWSLTTKTISLIEAAKDIIKKKITWNKTARTFQIQIEATNHFSLLGYLNYIFPKRRAK